MTTFEKSCFAAQHYNRLHRYLSGVLASLVRDCDPSFAPRLSACSKQVPRIESIDERTFCMRARACVLIDPRGRNP